MANRSYLLAVDDRSVTWSDDPKREIIAEGINEVPVFWASLFAPGDRQSDKYEGEEEELEIPNYCVASGVAKERLAALREPIGRLLDERSREVWWQWVDHLMTAESAYLKTNAAEVWELKAAEAAFFKTDADEVGELNSDGYDAYWGTLLRLFSEPSEANLRAAVEANDLSFEDGSVSWEDDEETICKLAGADHIREVPWLD